MARTSGISPADFLKVAQDVATKAPSSILVKNELGNLVVLNEEWTYMGYVDLRRGELHIQNVGE